MGRRKFDSSFKEGAVKLVLSEGRTYQQVCEELGLGMSTLQRWVKDARESGSVDGSNYASKLDMAAENRRLREELRIAQMERDILKKATAYFAKESK